MSTTNSKSASNNVKPQTNNARRKKSVRQRRKRRGSRKVEPLFYLTIVDLVRINSNMNSQEFEHIVPALRPILKAVGRQFFGNDDTVEDIAQETLMRLWMLRERIDPQIGVESLAVRMAKNLCVSEWRKQKVRRGKVLQSESTATLRPRIGDPATHEDIQHHVELKEEIARLRKAVSQLKPAEQRLFRMRHEAEMDIQQISAVTGIGVRSVSAMLSTAKRKLLEILNPKGGQQ